VVPLRAAVELAGLTPNDVRVEAVVGRVDSDGNLEDTTVIPLPVIEERGGVHLFGQEYAPAATGRPRLLLPDQFEPLSRPLDPAHQRPAQVVGLIFIMQREPA
jgi:starch phosphorylase